MSHVSVFVDEAVDALNVARGSRIVDGTINGGGHSARITRRMQGEGVLLGIDLDASALARAKERIGVTTVAVHLCEGNFVDMESLALAVGIPSVTGVLLDLGFSSTQLVSSGRGFSFERDEPLLMTFADVPQQGAFTARDIVNTWDENVLADIFYGYGEERYARRIAAHIVEARKHTPIETTTALVQIVRTATPDSYQRGRLHPATRTFQALRIAVNDEFGSLRKGIAAALRLLTPSGRLVVIAFDSGEDRIVKQAFREANLAGQGTVLTKRPLVPSEEEVRANPRARSAKMRIFEKQSV